MVVEIILPCCYGQTDRKFLFRMSQCKTLPLERSALILLERDGIAFASFGGKSRMSSSTLNPDEWDESFMTFGHNDGRKC